jgi:2-oxo-4-hydroxy-4-carboxy-5-ureidoimidazoline decarboxylase
MEPWQRLSLAPVAEARAMLRACCASARWIERMLDRRPFNSRDDLLHAARDEWFALGPDDWREAFRDHPKIGDREGLRRRFAATHHLSEREQAGVEGAPGEILDALADANAEYERKFGYIFIVCATGLTAGAMLDALRKRLQNDRDREILLAAEEQARITALRLDQ